MDGLQSGLAIEADWLSKFPDLVEQAFALNNRDAEHWIRVDGMRRETC